MLKYYIIWPERILFVHGLCVGPDGSDAEAVEVLDMRSSQEVRQWCPDLIVPTRWVRTDKNDGLVDKPFLAKSRLVVQGFKDKSPGFYRRDAP